MSRTKKEMKKIKEKFEELKIKGEQALIAYLTAGFPDFSSSIRIMKDVEKCGVDLLEIGVPFSDPIADGPVIQASSQKALEKGINLRKIFQLCETLKKSISIPYILMTYYNPVFNFGLDRFAKECNKTGVSGIIIPDLPVEENFSLNKFLKSYKIDLIHFLTPYTSATRAKKIISSASGFIYFVSVAGVTGTRNSFAPDLIKNVKEIKKNTSLPVAVGFGISNSKQVHQIGKVADGIIIGSYLIKKISEGKTKEMEQNLKKFKKILKK